ncbi:MAG: TRAP transporter substrate-binding protein DctP [Gammaproteobacteria bacterium]
MKQHRHILILLIVLLFITPRVEAYTFKIATLAPDGTTWMTEIRAAAQTISQRTGDRVRFRFYTGGVMGNEKSVLKKMRIQQLHGGAFSVGGLAEIYPDIQIYTLPFLFRSYAEVDYVRSKMDDEIRKGLAKNGMILFGMSDGGFAYLMSDTPVRSIDQLKDKKLWLPEGDVITQTVYEIANLASVPLPLSDVYTGLQTGMIDTIGSSPMGAIAFQWHTRIKYVTDIPLFYLVGQFVMDKRAFNKISTNDQTIVLEVMQTVMNKLNDLNRKDDAQARMALQNQGIEFISVNAEEQHRWEVIAKQSTEALGKKGVYTQQMYDLLIQYLSDFRNRSHASGQYNPYAAAHLDEK